MITEAMLPVADIKGGSVVGLSILCGFLIAIFSKTIEPPAIDLAQGLDFPPGSSASDSRIGSRARGSGGQPVGWEERTDADRVDGLFLPPPLVSGGNKMPSPIPSPGPPRMF